MSGKKATKYLGIGKTMFNTGATLLNIEESGEFSWLTILNERIERQKYSRAWPLKALKALEFANDDFPPHQISHNSDILAPEFKEGLLAKASPFYEMINAKGLKNCTEKENSEICYIEHHIAHAFSSLVVSPYAKCFILVMDGGGSKRGMTSLSEKGNVEEIEHTSLYFWDGSQLKSLLKEWLLYEEGSVPGLKFSRGVGSLYEKAAQFIFNDPLCSGKVMGLAGFGEKFDFVNTETDLIEFLNNLDWTKSYKGGSKEDWEENTNLSYWKNLAASVQFLFEENLLRIASLLSKTYFLEFGEHPLVMTGGCALNCTANERLRAQELIPEIFVSPFPGDESISLGCAVSQAYFDARIELRPKPWEKQNSFFGKEIRFEEVPKLFSEYEVSKIEDFLSVAEILKSGEVVAWFQGRSECGPRALGHRSLLASVGKRGIKNYLNLEIKFREEFRPYGASVLFEESDKYFDVPKGLQNPFMSFATPIREEWKVALKEVCHIDGTCRMQTVMKEQNESFYELLMIMKGLGELPVLLNTSLNIMGEPIVESLEDALDFMNQSKVNVMVVDRYMIRKKRP